MTDFEPRTSGIESVLSHNQLSYLEQQMAALSQFSLQNLTKQT